MDSLAIVSGGSGWLGRRLITALWNGLANVPAFSAPFHRSVRCLVHEEQDSEIITHAHPEAIQFAGDLRHADTLAPLFANAEGATVFHCAGLIHPGRVKDFYDVNVDGTQAMLNAAAQAGVKRFVHVSSNSPIGCNPNSQHRFDEESAYNPYMNYGRSKKEAEDLVNAAHTAGQIECVIIRPPWFYGPGQPPRQTEFFKMIKAGRMPVVGGGENRRSMAYVDNIVQGLLLCERTDAAAGRTYWIADERAYTMNEIITTVADVLEQDFGINVSRGQVNLPGIVSECALLADKLIQGLGQYHQKIHVLSEMNRNIACDISRAQKELGYEPKVALREGMRNSIQALLDDGASI